MTTYGKLGTQNTVAMDIPQKLKGVIRHMKCSICKWETDNYHWEEDFADVNPNICNNCWKINLHEGNNMKLEGICSNCSVISDAGKRFKCKYCGFYPLLTKSDLQFMVMKFKKLEGD